MNNYVDELIFDELTGGIKPEDAIVLERLLKHERWVAERREVMKKMLSYPEEVSYDEALPPIAGVWERVKADRRKGIARRIKLLKVSVALVFFVLILFYLNKHMSIMLQLWNLTIQLFDVFTESI